MSEQSGATGATGELAGRLLLEGELAPGRIRIEEGRIASVERDSSVPAGAPVIAPGLIDLHVHGFGGADPLEDLATMARALARAGTTAFQPTLFPRPPAQLARDAERVHAAAKRLAAGGDVAARVLGIHLEGPFLNRDAAGALDPDDLVDPSPAALRAVLGPATAGGRGVRTMTVAPELPGGLELVRELTRAGVRASLGHSRASAPEARAAFAAGAPGATHLFNAMRGFHHRDAGLAGAVLVGRGLFAEIIGDLVHVAPEAFELALAARGPGGLCLVSDALSGAGTGCDAFHSHGRAHIVREGAAFHPADEAHAEPRLAGSATSQLEMIRRLHAAGVCSLADALTMASTSPARALGLDSELGALRPGLAADLIVLAGPELDLQRVLVAGREA